MKPKTIEAENIELRTTVEDLRDRVIALIEVLHQILPYPSRMAPEVTRLRVADYQAYLRILEYFTANDKHCMTSFSVGKLILNEYQHDYKSLECCLLNLKKMGLIRLEIGTTYPIIYISEKTVFDLHRKK